MYSCIFKNHERAVIEIDDEELVEKILNGLEDMIKSSVYHCDYKTAQEYINAFLKLESVYKEMIGEETNNKCPEDVCD